MLTVDDPPPALQRAGAPVDRSLSDQRHPRFFHRRRWVEALGYGLGDQGLALLREERDESLFLGDEFVDGRRLPVEKVSYSALLLCRGDRDGQLLPLLGAKCLGAMCCFLDSRQDRVVETC